jgi:hypothetical protein
MNRFEVQYLIPGRRGIARIRATDHPAAAKAAVDVARGGCRDVVVMRFDPETGWSVAGYVHQFEGRGVEPLTLIYQDGRTPRQRAADQAEAEARDEKSYRAPEPAGRRSGMRVFSPGLRRNGRRQQ